MLRGSAADEGGTCMRLRWHGSSLLTQPKIGAMAHHERAPNARDLGAADLLPTHARHRMMIASNRDPVSVIPDAMSISP